MNLSAAAANAACDEFPYVPSNAGAAPPSLLPIMEQESSIHREHHHQLGYNLEANSLALLPPSNAAAHHHATTIAGHSPHDILQFYPASASHYLASAAAAGGNPYSHFSAGTGGSTFHQSSYYPPAAPEYYFPTLVSSAEENMASFAATQLGLNLGYRTYFPPRGGYTYGHHPPRCQAEGCKADLSSAKRYHRRHKVCEHHSKAPVVVTAGGLHQRFCQQCSRSVSQWIRFESVQFIDDRCTSISGLVLNLIRGVNKLPLRSGWVINTSDIYVDLVYTYISETITSCIK